MAIQRYQYETSPRKLEEIYRQEKPKVPKKNVAPRKKTVSKTEIIHKSNRTKIIISLIAVFASIFAISYRNSKIDESFTKNEELKQAYLSIEKENEQMKVDIENSLNFSNIAQEAQQLLGMQKLSTKQIIYVNLPKKDYIQPAAESIVIEKDESIFDKILNALKDKSSVKVIIQSLINKFWFRTDDIFTIEDAQKQIGKEEKEKVSTTISENAKETNYNFLLNKLISRDTSISESFNKYTQNDYVYDTKLFSQELKTFEAIRFYIRWI